MNYENVTFATFNPKYGLVHIVLTAVLLGLIIICTVIGNMFVVAAILLDRNLQRVSNYLILSLAIADLMVATLVMPMSALHEVSDKWWLGVSLCDIWTVMDVLCCTASILHLVAIAIDRYWAITKLNYVRTRTTKPILCMIAIVWVTALAISLPTRFHNSRDEYQVLVEGLCQINDEYAFTIFSTVGAFYLPMTFLICVYAKIYQAAQKRIRKRRFRTSAVVPNTPSSISATKQSNGTIGNQVNKKTIRVSMNVRMKQLRTRLPKLTHLKSVVCKRPLMNNGFTHVSFGETYGDRCEEISERDMSITFNDDLSPTSNNSFSYCSSSNPKSSSGSGTFHCYFGPQSGSCQTPSTEGTMLMQICHSSAKCFSNYRSIVQRDESKYTSSGMEVEAQKHCMDSSQTTVLGPIDTHVEKSKMDDTNTAIFSSENLPLSYSDSNGNILNKNGIYFQSKCSVSRDRSSLEETFSCYSTLTDDQDGEREVIPCSVSHSELSIVLKRTAISDSDTDSVSYASNQNHSNDQLNAAAAIHPVASNSYNPVTSPFLIEFNPCSPTASCSTLHNSAASNKSGLSFSPHMAKLHWTDQNYTLPISPYVHSGQSTSSLQSVNTFQSLHTQSEGTRSSLKRRTKSCNPEILAPSGLMQTSFDSEKNCDILVKWVHDSDPTMTPSSVPKTHPGLNNLINQFSFPASPENIINQVKPDHSDFSQSDKAFRSKPKTADACKENDASEQCRLPSNHMKSIPAISDKPTLNKEPQVSETANTPTTTLTSPPLSSTTLTSFTGNCSTVVYDRMQSDKSFESINNHVPTAFPFSSNAVLEAEHHRERVESRRERKAARTLAIITGCFILCWFPFFVRALYAPFCMPTCPLPDWVQSLLLWLGYLNSLLNPVLYTVFSPDFRNAFKKIVCGRLSIRAN